MNIKTVSFERAEVANEGYRYIMPYKEMRALLDPLNVEEIESSLTLSGLQGMIPRNEAKGSFSHQAGIIL
jgi:hypothetical protein